MSDGGQIKLLGFAGPRAVADHAGLRKVITAELLELRAALGARMTVICGAAPGTNLVFLRACVELRIPAIVLMSSPEEDFADRDELILSRHLTGVALAKYVVPSGDHGKVERHLLDWADAFLIVSDGAESSPTVAAARDLGIPSRIIGANCHTLRWEVAPDHHRPARHGFDNRADLLDFLDARFAAC